MLMIIKYITCLIIFSISSCVLAQDSYYELYDSFMNQQKNIREKDSIIWDSIKYDVDFQNQERLIIEQKIEQEELEQAKQALWRSNIEKSSFVIGILILVLIIVNFIYLLIKNNRIKKESNRALENRNNTIERQRSELLAGVRYSKHIQDLYIKCDKQELESDDIFVFSKPKDIVGGDFYWIYTINDEQRLIIVGDCTGHGVPGGFLSVIVHTVLKSIVIDSQITEPKLILEALHNRLMEQLKSEGSDSIDDGLDLIVVLQNKKEKTLKYSSAKFLAHLVKKSELIPLDCDMQSIGNSALLRRRNPKPINMTTFKLHYENNDMLYLSSDGYIDQFNSAKEKYNLGRYRQLISSISEKKITDQKETVALEFDLWKGDSEQIDDVILIGLILK